MHEISNPGSNIEKKTHNAKPIYIALLFIAAIYLFQFIFGDGYNYISADGRAYLSIARGEHLFVPFNSRVLKCLLAYLLSHTGLSLENSFRLLTPIEIMSSLVLLARMIGRRGGTIMWQVALIVALGCPLAMFFGHTPIYVDTLLLLLVCLLITALDHNRLWLALLFACLAAATKEYGIILGLMWGAQAFRRGYRWLALLGAGLPAATLGTVMIAHPARTWEVPDGTSNFFWSSIKYMQSLPDLVGISNFPKLIYIWMWFIIWPVLFLAFLMLIANVRKQFLKDSDTLNFALALVFFPILLLGDWNRSLLLLIPFACALATSHPLAKDYRFALLLAAGGFCTSVTQPYFYTFTFPRAFNVVMILGSFLVSVAIVVMIIRFSKQKEAVVARV